MLNLDTRDMETPCYMAKLANVLLTSFCGTEGEGGGAGLLCLFVKSFLSGFRAKTAQEHLFTSHRSTCEVWVDSDILENFSRNGGYVVLMPRAIQLLNIIFCMFYLSHAVFWQASVTSQNMIDKLNLCFYIDFLLSYTSNVEIIFMNMCFAN